VSSLLHSEGIMIPWNRGNCTINTLVPPHRRLQSSATPLWEPQISHVIPHFATQVPVTVSLQGRGVTGQPVTSYFTHWTGTWRVGWCL